MKSPSGKTAEGTLDRAQRKIRASPLALTLLTHVCDPFGQQKLAVAVLALTQLLFLVFVVLFACSMLHAPRPMIGRL
jgi:hypothetical protein